MARLLVINADDFGLTPGVNAGMLDAHRRGVLTSVSLFANAPATTEAIALARDTPSLGIGCHLALVDAAPLLPLAQVRTLVGPDERFPPSWGPFITACLGGRVSLQEVERELTAQVEFLINQGLRLTHLDSHKHVHAYPPIFAIVCRLAVRFGIPTVRVPEEFPWFGPVPGDLSQLAIARQAFENLALRVWTRRDGARLALSGLQPRRFYGRVHTGRLSEAALREMTARMPEDGVSELMTHPGYVDAALAAMPTRLRQSREDEVRLLCSPRIRGVFEEAGVTLVRHDLHPKGTYVDQTSFLRPALGGHSGLQ